MERQKRRSRSAFRFATVRMPVVMTVRIPTIRSGGESRT